MQTGQAGFFSDPPLARNSRFALAFLSPLFPWNKQNITPVLQAIYSQSIAIDAIMQIANGQISNRSKTKTKSEVIACLLSTLYQIDQSETSLFEVKLLVVIMGLGYCNQCNAYLIDRWSWWSVRWALVTRTWITQYSTNPILVCSWATLKPCVMLSLTKSGTTMAVNECPNHSLNQLYQDNFVSGSKFSCSFRTVCSKFLLYLRYRKDCHVVLAR